MRFSAVLLPALLVLVSTSLPAAVTFQSPRTITTGMKHLTGIAVADFNGDGKPDIAATDDYTQSLVVYLNDGKGAFNPTPQITTLHIPDMGGFGALVAGDLNGDGKQDLIIGPVGGNQIDVVLLGNGDGSFSQGERVDGSYSFFTAALTDINGDDHLDLLSAQNPGASVALGDGKGNFEQRPVVLPQDIGFGTGLVAGDFAGSHHVDFITSDYLGNKLHFFRGNGDGTFQPATTVVSSYTLFPSSLADADFNGDGKLDLAVGIANAGMLLFGNGDGTFQTQDDQAVFLPLARDRSVPHDSSVETPPFLATADMDGDGKSDIVAADHTYNKLSVLLNDGTGLFPQAKPDFVDQLDGFSTVTLADVNGDGLPDMVVGNGATQNLAIYLSVRPRAKSSLSLESSSSTAFLGTPVSVSVQVTAPANSAASPTGTVTLTSGTTQLGTQTLSGAGKASFDLSTLAAGEYPLTATYSGDAAFLGASVSNLTQAIVDYQVALPTSTQTVQAGASATYSLDLKALGGFTGPVAVSCAGLPPGYHCTPSTITVSSQTTTTASVTVGPAATLPSSRAQRTAATRHLYPGAFAASAFALLLFRQRRLSRVPALFSVIVLLGGLAGCGGGSQHGSSTGGGSSPNPVAPYTGTTTFTITTTATAGSQTLSRQVTATLIVQ